MKLKTVFLPILLIAAGAVFFAVTQKPSAPSSSFSLISGEQLSVDSLRGRVVLVNFWATSCVTCVAEMPQMVQLSNDYRDKSFSLVAVAMPYDPIAFVKQFASTRQLPFAVAHDSSGTLVHAWGDVALTPTSFLLDKQGRILKKYVGQPNFAELRQTIDSAI